MKFVLDSLDFTISEDYNDKFEALEDLEDFSDDLERHTPEEIFQILKKWVKKTRRTLREELIEDGHCPDCGEELEEEVETDIGYLDGRPAYQVSEVVGRYCPECGWEE
jgi:hypothetical protein